MTEEIHSKSQKAPDQPIFVTGHLVVTVDGVSASYENRSISLYGATGLPWDNFDPKKHFGHAAKVQVGVLGKMPLSFSTPAMIVREQSAGVELMGVRFNLNSQHQRDLALIIEKTGFYPKEYARKYPRIPNNPELGSFPMRVVVTLSGESQKVQEGKPKRPMIFEVGNISLGGVLLSSENLRAQELVPGTQVNLFMEPRGDFGTPLAVQGQVCWFLDDIHNENENSVRHLGVKFTYLDEENRTVFLELMKDILEKIRSAGM